MGYIMHHAIVVTSWNAKELDAAQDKALKLGCAVTNIAESPHNGFATFLIAPDGSNEGWPESDVGDAQRKAFMAWVAAEMTYEDGSSCLSIVEVTYGDDEARVVTHPTREDD